MGIMTKPIINFSRFISSKLIVYMLLSLAAILLLPNLTYTNQWPSVIENSSKQLPFLEKIVPHKVLNSFGVVFHCSQYTSHQKFELINPNRIVIDFLNIEKEREKTRTQKGIDLDILFKKARTLAFEGNRKEAIEICKNILEKKPEYHDVRVFLGRIYAWDKEYDLARRELLRVTQENPSHLDAKSALIDVEYWANDLEQALKYCDEGLKKDPSHREFLYKKAQILEKQGNYEGASESIYLLLKMDSGHTDAQELLNRIQFSTQLFEAKVKYGYDHFNRGEEDFGPWHLASFDLSKKIKWGTVIGRINYANRNFGSISKSGPQFEIDLYPRITKGFYAYVNGGYSSSSVFPKYRFGGELYKSLPSGFEISAGARYLDFSTAKVLIYTGNLGKYYKNYWFSLRPFVTSKTSGIDISGILLIRKYQNNPGNYISLLLGIGSSPIELFFLEDIERLNSYKIGLEIVQMVSRSTLIEIQIRFEREEFQTGKFGNRYTLSFSLLQTFFKKY